MRRRWVKRLALAGAALPVVFLAAALLAPRFEASSLREPLRSALSELLGRPVEFREVRYTLFPAVGVTATDLVIPEDAAFGLEPIAYVTELQAGIHWSSLFRRRLVFSSLRLVEASVNLSRDDELGWNVGRLLAQAEAQMRTRRHAPDLSLRGGRVNFKQGTLKSPFFLNGVDIDVNPPRRADGHVRWRFEASPARTDRSEQGFGRFTGEGQRRAGGSLGIDIDLERSATSEVATLLADRDLGLQGRVAARIRLDGPPDALALRGRLEIEGFERGGRFAPRGKEWVLPFEGSVDLGRQSLELRTLEAKDAAGTPLKVLLAAQALFTRPRVEAAFTLDGFPAATFLDVARRLGAETPPGFTLSGTLHGALALAEQTPLNGEVELRDAEVRLGEAGPVSIPAATVRLAAGAVELPPTELHTPSGATVELAGRWSAAPAGLSFRARFPALPLDELNAALGRLPAPVAPAPLRPCREGMLSGDLRYELAPGGTGSVWAADLLLQGVRCEAEEWGGALRWLRAPLTVRGSQWTIRNATVRWKERDAIITVESGRPGPRPLRIAVQAPEVDASELEAFLHPAVSRRGSFLERTLRRPPPAPAWLAARRAEIQLTARRLLLAGEEFERLVLRAFWDGEQIDIPELEARQAGALFQGRAALQLRPGGPVVHVQGRADQAPLGGGLASASIDLRTAGLGRTLLERLQISGRVDVRRVAAGAERLDWLAACYDYDAARPAPARLQLSCLEAGDAGEYFTAAPLAAPWDRVVIELNSAQRSVVVTWPAQP